MTVKIPLAEYLFRRLHQTGLRAVHGVPGDYNLTLLDHVIPSGLEWVGNCNELNGGYAADGYARVKGIGAIVTTFGVGELSAINAIAGSYAEMAPVVHIVGTPMQNLQSKGVKLHHSFCSGAPRDYELFAEMYERVTVAKANLLDVETAPAEIDRVIRACLEQSRPVYLRFPMDMVGQMVPESLLSTSLQLPPVLNDLGQEGVVAQRILQKILDAKQPMILVDGGASRYGLSRHAQELVETTGFPTTTTPFGKGIIEENLPNFHGIYATVGDFDYDSYVKGCDLVVNLGPVHSNVNTYYFATVPKEDITITIDRTSIRIGEEEVAIRPGPVLDRVIESLRFSESFPVKPRDELPTSDTALQQLPDVNPTDKFSQSIFWRRMSHFFRPGDILLTETGTASLGARDFVLPRDTTLINSSVWLSIGYMLPASQGAALAQRHIVQSAETNSQSATPQGRTILFQGDGSFQMTAQEMSTILHKKLDMIVFLINNNGYTIERLIHGPEESYNDVAPWKYLECASFFGVESTESYPTLKARVSTWGELDEVLAKRDFHSGKGLRMVEVMMEKEDCNDTLRLLLDIYKAKKG
ncbi:thiamine diphosphate-binding protein [Penicillium argentinense]|uniref:Pyruvate decarboxylase n=1 Tax=Penicillium argentinense TaxID=1131581 RepID=A0A9W9G1R9_9EURO|nr:thiamine diphosphate-binding protein [Penicillium argentinense]KAJ5110498.1 thiamine diphosphate-binding protein [Penicillium argentinense]